MAAARKKSSWMEERARDAKRHNEAWQERARLDRLEEKVLMLANATRDDGAQLGALAGELAQETRRLRGALRAILNAASHEKRASRESLRMIRRVAREGLAKEIKP